MPTRPAAPAPKRSTVTAPDPAVRVLRRFRLVFNAVKTHFREVEKKAGISGAQLWALHVVHEHPGIGVGEYSLSGVAVTRVERRDLMS